MFRHLVLIGSIALGLQAPSWSAAQQHPVDWPSIPLKPAAYDKAPSENDRAEVFALIKGAETGKIQAIERLSLLFARRFNLPLDPGALRQALRQTNLKGKAAFQDSRPDFKVIKHIKADSGIPFPEKGVIQYPKMFSAPLPKLDDLRPLLEKTAHQLKASAGRQSAAQPLKLPKCENDKTHRFATGYRAADGKAPVLDILFLGDTNLPMDHHDVVGRKTMVVRYGAKPGDPLSQMALRFGVTCLPYRIRSTKGLFLRHEGLDALKNYDRDPYGRGQLHPVFKDKTHKPRRGR